MNTSNYCRKPLQSTYEARGFAAHIPSQNSGMWNGLCVAQGDGKSLMGDSADKQAKVPSRSYMTPQKCWETITEEKGVNTAISFGGGLFYGLTSIALYMLELWPVSAEGLNLVVATVPRVVMGLDITTLLNITSAIGIGSSCIVGSVIVHLSMKYLHTKIFGEKKECRRQLRKAIDECNVVKEFHKQAIKTKKRMMRLAWNLVPWEGKFLTPSNGRAELDRRYAEHLTKLNAMNRELSSQGKEQEIVEDSFGYEAKKSVSKCYYDAQQHEIELRSNFLNSLDEASRIMSDYNLL